MVWLNGCMCVWDGNRDGNPGVNASCDLNLIEAGKCRETRMSLVELS